MANGNLTLQAMKSFDAPGSMNRGTQMAANEMNMQKMQQQKQRQEQLGGIRQQAMEGGYEMDKHKDLLMSQGYFEEALDLQELADNAKKDEQDITKSGLEILNKTAKVTATLGEAGWPSLRGALVNSGMARPEDLPEKYDEQAQKIASSLVGNTNKALKVIKFREGNEQKDMLVSGGQVVKTGEPYDPTGKSGSGSDFDLKASDSNSIRNAAAGLYGGFINPETGKISGVNADEQKNINAISSAAQRIYMDSQGQIPHDEAVRKAAGRMDIDIKDLMREQAETHTGKLQELGLPEKAARQIAAEALMKRDVSDLDAGQKAYQIAMRAFQGDSEEAEKVRKRVIEMRARNRIDEEQDDSGESSGQYEEGKVYEDAQGNKARYVNGQWEPVE